MRTNILGTSLEQAEKLVNAGLNPNRADLHYTNVSYKGPDYEDGMILSNLPYNEAMKLYDETGFTSGLFFKCIPAWSLGALWNILYHSGIKYGPNTFTMDSQKLTNLLVIWVIDAINQGRISPEYLTSAEATEE